MPSRVLPMQVKWVTGVHLPSFWILSRTSRFLPTLVPPAP